MIFMVEMKNHSPKTYSYEIQTIKVLEIAKILMTR